MIIEIKGTIQIDRDRNAEGKINHPSGKEFASSLMEVIDLFNAMSSNTVPDEDVSKIGNTGFDIAREDPEITVRFTNRPYDVDRERRRCL